MRGLYGFIKKIYRWDGLMIVLANRVANPLATSMLGVTPYNFRVSVSVRFERLLLRKNLSLHPIPLRLCNESACLCLPVRGRTQTGGFLKDQIVTRKYMTIEDIKKIGVVGAGIMGRGIAQIFAIYNYPVTLVDKEVTILQAALEGLKKRTEPELWDKVSSLLSTSTNIDMLRDCDLVVEAVFEDEAVKKEVFRRLNSVCKSNAIIATNTSSISINKLAIPMENPDRFIGMHFMNPPRLMKLVEIIRGEKTSEETVKTIIGLTKAIEKIPAVINDSPGFVSNRLLFALIGEAIRLLEHGIASKEDIDTVMKYGMNHPMGPIALADLIGLDICQGIMLQLYNNLGDDRYKPSPLLETMVKKGRLGRKTGEGFYKYT